MLTADATFDASGPRLDGFHARHPTSASQQQDPSMQEGSGITWDGPSLAGQPESATLPGP